MRSEFILLAISCLIGCASGSAIVIGETRPAIEDWQSVIITTEMPDGAVQIALVKASSDAGISKQRSVDYAIDELKQQAAKVGANTVVLGATSAETEIVGVPSGTSRGYIIPNQMEVVEGIAAFADR